MPPADFGAQLFSGLKADISSDEANMGRRRRAYTEMDALLADDIKQNEASLSEAQANQPKLKASRDPSQEPKLNLR